LAADIEHESFTSSRCRSENSETFWKKNKLAEVATVDFVCGNAAEFFGDANTKQTYAEMDKVCQAAETLHN